MSGKRYPKNVHKVHAILRDLYRDFDHYNRQDPLEELIFILFSIRTDEDKYLSVFENFQRAFDGYADILNVDTNDIASIIRPAGMSHVKSKAIKGILTRLVDEFGYITLAPLATMTDEQCEAFLTSLPMVGRKIARCVMMYSFNRQLFPVDAHCWRIAQRLGWVRKTRANGSCSNRDMTRLQNRIPPELRFSLHVNFISLGRAICIPRNPRCSTCPLCRECVKIGIGKSKDKTQGQA